MNSLSKALSERQVAVKDAPHPSGPSTTLHLKPEWKPHGVLTISAIGLLRDNGVSLLAAKRAIERVIGQEGGAEITVYGDEVEPIIAKLQACHFTVTRR